MKIVKWSQKGCGIFLTAPFKILPLLLVLAAGCASHSRNHTLFDAYSLYAYKVRERDYQYVVDRLLTRSMTSRELTSSSDFSDYYPILSDLPDILVRNEKHFEMRDGNFGCLTLNGFDRFDRPAVIKMEFGKEQERWKLDYVSVDYLDSPAGFKHSAVCPKRQS